MLVKAFVVALVALSLGGCGGVSAVSPPRAEGLMGTEPWNDGAAEVAEYELVQFYYGKFNKGGSVTVISIPEDADTQTLVKALPSTPADKRVPIIKYHTVRTFPTPPYRYEQAWTTLIRRDDGSPLRYILSHHEWCGSAGKTWSDTGADAALTTMSYFDGHGDIRQPLTVEENVYFEDQLPFILRDYLSRGDIPESLNLVPSQVSAKKQSVTVTPHSISVGEPTRLSVPEGSHSVRWVTVTDPSGSADTYAISVTFPHVLIAAEMADGSTWRLRNLRRMKYWER